MDTSPKVLQSRPFSNPGNPQSAVPGVQTRQDEQERQRFSEFFDLTKIDLFAGSSASESLPGRSLQRSEGGSPEADVDEKQEEVGKDTLQRKCADCAAEDGDDKNTLQAKLAIGQPNDLYEQEAVRAASPEENRVATEEVEKLNAPSPPPGISQAVNSIAQRELIQPKSLIQRQGGGNLQASDDVERAISDTRGQGRSLDDSVRQPMEQAFGADFSGVRIHTNGRSDVLNQAVQAKAFTTGQNIYFRSGAYEPGSRGGQELLAHELTHTIQQTGGNKFQSKPKQQPDAEASEPLQTKAIANNIAPLKLKTLQPKVNAEETLQAKQLDEDVLAQQTDNQLDASGSKSEASIQPKAISTLGSTITVNKILSFRSTTDTSEVPEEDSETQPIQAKSIDSLPKHHISQESCAVDGKLTQQKVVVSAAPVGVQRAGGGVSWIMRQVGNLLKKLPGFGLLSTLLGKNPVTGEAVERSATSVIGGILKFIGKDDLFQKLKESNAIEKAFAWFSQQITKLNLTWTVIRGLFSKAWDSLSGWDLLKPVTAFNKISKIFSAPLQRIRNFAASVIGKVGEFIFQGAMKLAGSAGQKVMGILKRAGGLIGNIIKNPVGFVGNLVKAIKGGFQKFAANIGTHLKTGLMGWLFGALAGAGLALPQTFNLKGIIDIVLQVVGATYQNLRQMLVEKIGEKRVAQLEKAFEFVKMLATDGLAGAWQKIMEFAGNLQEMVIGGIKNWVMNSVVGAAITKLVTMFNPAGALIQAAMSIYNAIMFFVERAQQIAALANSVFSSISKIAAGNVGAAIGFIEQSMARTLPVIISFLARQVGLGDVAGAIKGIIGKVRGVIQGAIGKVVNFIVSRAKSLLGGGTQGTQSATADRENATNTSKNQIPSETHFQDQTGEKHRMWMQQTGNRYRLMVASGKPSPISTAVKSDGEFADIDGSEESQVISDTQKVENLVNEPESTSDASSKKQEISKILGNIEKTLSQSSNQSRPAELQGLSTPYLDRLEIQEPGVTERYVGEYQEYKKNRPDGQPLLKYVEGRAARKLGRRSEAPTIASYASQSGVSASKNNQAIEFLKGQSANLMLDITPSRPNGVRIPDIFVEGTVVADLKNTNRVDLDAQMRDDVRISNGLRVRKKGGNQLLPPTNRFDLIVRMPSEQHPSGTHVSAPLQAAIAASGGSVYELIEG
ncbi:MAG: DUF4157 domain-containing protein [Cyanothece sp. SIO2G6]|nr:DUF4157 domain-containing protein [Cyanothece sp. SIO2G6]